MRWLIASIFVLSGLVTLPVSAAEPAEPVGCDQTAYDKISTKHENSGGIPIAEARKEDEEWYVVIDQSSKSTYLSDQTIQWLVFRQCYFAYEHISDDQRKILSKAETADCWAANQLRDNLKYSDRELETIQYDLELLSKKAKEDWRILLGPLRSPYLLKCL